MTDTAAVIRRYWACADRRDWEGFASILRFNRDYPGDWQVTVRRVVADETGGVARTDFAVGEESMTGLHFFTVDAAGLICRVDDFWPESYEPPPGRDHLVERF